MRTRFPIRSLSRQCRARRSDMGHLETHPLSGLNGWYPLSNRTYAGPAASCRNAPLADPEQKAFRQTVTPERSKSDQHDRQESPCDRTARNYCASPYGINLDDRLRWRIAVSRAHDFVTFSRVPRFSSLMKDPNPGGSNVTEASGGFLASFRARWLYGSADNSVP